MPVYTGPDTMLLHNTEQNRWYALQVTTRKETLVSTILTGKGYECYVPLYPKRRVWSDRVKGTLAPVFSGYVFTRFDVQHRLPILVTPNVQAIVGAGKLPMAIPESEVEQIRKALQSGMPIEPYDQLREGDLVRVIRGPLSGIEGVFVHYRGASRLIVSVSTIRRSISIEMDRSCVEPLPVSGISSGTNSAGRITRAAHV